METLPPGPDKPRHRHIPELDGMRGIAILAVVIFHFAPPRLAPGLFRNVLESGWAGVDLFFVLSGFLITGILIRTRDSEGYFRNFYARRILRIFPLYYSALFLFFVVGLSILHSNSWGPMRGEQAWYWFYLSNIRTAAGHFAISPVGHFWSLAIEEQFYLAWPLVVLLLPESWLLWGCLALPLLCATIRCTPGMQALGQGHGEFLYRMTFCRLDGLALGACVALLDQNQAWKRAAAPLVRWLLPLSAIALAAIVRADGSAHYSGRWMSAAGYSVLATLFAGLLFLTVTRRGGTALLRSAWLRKLGNRSYAVYVIHVPVLFALGKYLRFDGLGGCFAAVAIGLSVSYAGACLSWHLLEKRFVLLKERVAPRTEGVGRARILTAAGPAQL